MQWWLHCRNCVFVNVAWRETQEMKVAIFLEDSGFHRTVILRRYNCWNSGQCNFCFLCNLFGLYTECVLMLWNHLAICCTTLYQDTSILCCCSLKFLKMVNLMLSALLCLWGSPSKNTGVGCHASFRGSSQSRDQTPTSYISCIGRWVLYHYHIKLIKKKNKLKEYLGSKLVFLLCFWNFFILGISAYFPQPHSAPLQDSCIPNTSLKWVKEVFKC